MHTQSGGALYLLITLLFYESVIMQIGTLLLLIFHIGWIDCRDAYSAANWSENN